MNLVDDQSQRKSNVADFDDQAYIQLQSQHLGGRGGDDGSNTHKRTLLSKHILPHICLHHTLN